MKIKKAAGPGGGGGGHRVVLGLFFFLLPKQRNDRLEAFHHGYLFGCFVLFLILSSRAFEFLHFLNGYCGGAVIIETHPNGVDVCVCALCFSPAPTLRAHAVTLLFMYLATKLFQLSYIRKLSFCSALVTVFHVRASLLLYLTLGLLLTYMAKANVL